MEYVIGIVSVVAMIPAIVAMSKPDRDWKRYRRECMAKTMNGSKKLYTW